MNKRKRNLLISLISILIVPVLLWGARTGTVTGKAPHKIPETKAKIKIDGILDADEWQGALRMTLDYETDPGENISPPVETEVFLAYNSKHLYIGFRAKDPDPTQIRAHITDRDNIWNDDYVGIVLDTFNDSRLTHNLYCNPHGIQADQMSTLTDNAVTWDAIWNSAGRITEEGYTVEMAIPFTSLRFQGKKGEQTWGFDAVRNYPRSHVHTIGLFPRDRDNNCYMCQADKIGGFSGAKPGNNLEFDPTLSGTLTQERDDFPRGEYRDTRKRVEPGLTARWSFTPNMTLNAAVNPDFSQVEADAAQLNINNQFALYYPEKRPFFQEGSTIFHSRLRPVHTRTVADPEWGLKLTGKEGRHAVGFFTARDTLTNLILPTSQGSSLISLDMKNYSTAFRYRWDLGKSSNIGAYITDREGRDYYNRVVGIDGDVRFTKSDRVQFQYLGSQSRYPDHVASEYGQPAGKFAGGALNAAYTHETQNVFVYAHYQDISPNFRSDAGFLDQAGIRLYDLEGGHVWRKPQGHWYTNFTLWGWCVIVNDYRGKMVVRSYQGTVSYNGPLQSYISLRMNWGKRAYSVKTFDDNNFTFTITARPSGSLYLGVSGNIGDQVDFTNIRAGDRVQVNPFIRYNIGRHLNLGIDHVYEKLNVEGGWLYTANLTNLSIIYQFNRRAFFRAILQYADYDYNTELYIEPREPRFNHLFSQLLFSYKINPRTVLFLGYSDDYFGYDTVPLRRNNRTFFMKLGYALVL